VRGHVSAPAAVQPRSDLDRALEAMSAPKLRSFVPIVFDRLDTISESPLQSHSWPLRRKAKLPGCEAAVGACR
jgi:hypothetical protein